MNKEQGIYLNTFLATQAYLDEQTSVWSAIPKITSYKNNLDELIARIGEKSEEVHQGTGVGKRKEALKTGIAVKLSSVSGILQSFALDTGNNDLALKVKLSKSDILKLKDTELESNVKSVLGEAQNHLAELADYGLTNAVLEEVQTSLDEFHALLGKPRSILNNKYVALSSLDELFNECNDLLRNRMDNLMLMFRDNQAEFYEGYQRARTIVGR